MPVDPLPGAPVDLLRARLVAGEPLGLAPCACWACTCGAAGSARPGSLQQAPVRSRPVVCVAGASGAGEEDVPSAGGLVVVVVVVVWFAREARRGNAQRQRSQSESGEQQAEWQRSSGHRVIRCRGGS